MKPPWPLRLCAARPPMALSSRKPSVICNRSSRRTARGTTIRIPPPSPCRPWPMPDQTSPSLPRASRIRHRFPEINESVSVAATVSNTGQESAADIPVRFYDGDPAEGGILIAEDIIAAVSAGGMGTASVTWTPEPRAFMPSSWSWTRQGLSWKRRSPITVLQPGSGSIKNRPDCAGDCVHSDSPVSAVDVQVKVENQGGLPAQR